MKRLWEWLNRSDPNTQRLVDSLRATIADAELRAGRLAADKAVLNFRIKAAQEALRGPVPKSETPAWDDEA